MRIAERELARGPVSMAETRRWLQSVVTSFGLGRGAAEDVLLVASELLSNAFLHAAGPYSVSAEMERDRLRVGVRDRSTTLPVLKDFEELAATGRGLRIVAATALGWGADPLPDGKVVWADLALPDTAEAAGDDDRLPGPARSGGWSSRSGGDSGTSPNLSAPPRARAGQHTAARTGRDAALAATAPPLGRVVFREVPVGDFLAMRARIEAALRESTLIVLGGEREDVPGELLTLAEQATTRFREVARAEASASPEPCAVGEDGLHGDFAVDYPLAAAGQLEAFAEVVRSLNRWCESSHLLVAPLSEEMLRLHRWSVREAVRQLRLGDEPAVYAPA